MSLLDFFTIRPKAFGLDVSDLSLKFAYLKKKSGFLGLRVSGSQVVERECIVGGEIRDEEILIRSIKEVALKMKRFGIKHVVCSLPEEKAFLQVIQMPKMKDEELQKAVYFEAENYIPMPLGEAYIDFTVVHPMVDGLDHIDVLIAALPKVMVDSYLSCLKEAGLRPIALEIESLAIARALVKNEESQDPVLLLDFGATRTGFTIFSGRSVRFTASIPISSSNLSQAIAAAFGAEAAEAERLKIKYGISDRKTKDGKEAFNAIIPKISALTSEIKKYLEYYITHTAHEHTVRKKRGASAAYLCGGGANLKGLPAFLSAELKIPVAMGNPWVNILPLDIKEVPAMSYEQSLEYATALGLALRDKDRN